MAYRYSKQTSLVVEFLEYTLKIITLYPHLIPVVRAFIQAQKQKRTVENRPSIQNKKCVQEFIEIFWKWSVNKIYTMEFKEVKIIDLAFPFIIHDDNKEVKYHILKNISTPTTIFHSVMIPEPFVISYKQDIQFVYLL